MSRRDAMWPPKRILVRCPNWLGDVVMATPGYRALRKTFPDSQIVGLVPAGLAPVLDGSLDFDEVWTFDRLGRLEWMRQTRRIAENPFDLGIAIPESVSSAWMMRMGRVRHVVGFARDPLRRALLHEVVPAPSEWGRRRLVSKERFVLFLMSALGVPSEDTRLEVVVTEEENARLVRRLRNLEHQAVLDASSPLVLMAPGASFGDAKCWPTASFAVLADRLIARGRRVVLVGTEAERPRIATLRQHMAEEATDLSGQLDLGELKALLSRSRTLIANDAGTRHLATALGVPSVIFFGPTSVGKTNANLAIVEVLETEHDCRPCYLRTCPIDHRCMTSIQPDEAMAAYDRLAERIHPVSGQGPSFMLGDKLRVAGARG